MSRENFKEIEKQIEIIKSLAKQVEDKFKRIREIEEKYSEVIEKYRQTISEVSGSVKAIYSGIGNIIQILQNLGVEAVFYYEELSEIFRKYNIEIVDKEKKIVKIGDKEVQVVLKSEEQEKMAGGKYSKLVYESLVKFIKVFIDYVVNELKVNDEKINKIIGDLDNILKRFDKLISKQTISKVEIIAQDKKTAEIIKKMFDKKVIEGSKTDFKDIMKAVVEFEKLIQTLKSHIEDWYIGLYAKSVLDVLKNIGKIFIDFAKSFWNKVKRIRDIFFNREKIRILDKKLSRFLETIK